MVNNYADFKPGSIVPLEVWKDYQRRQERLCDSNGCLCLSAPILDWKNQNFKKHTKEIIEKLYNENMCLQRNLNKLHHNLRLLEGLIANSIEKRLAALESVNQDVLKEQKIKEAEKAAEEERAAEEEIKQAQERLGVCVEKRAQERLKEIVQQRQQPAKEPSVEPGLTSDYAWAREFVLRHVPRHFRDDLKHLGLDSAHTAFAETILGAADIFKSAIPLDYLRIHEALHLVMNLIKERLINAQYEAAVAEQESTTSSDK